MVYVVFKYVIISRQDIIPFRGNTSAKAQNFLECGEKMNNIQIFNYNGKPVRTVSFPDGSDGFIGKDICDVLEISNSRDAIARLDDDEKGVVLTDTPGGVQELQAVTESGLYSLVLTSRKPEAKAFKRWITHEVLPSIRKHGMYATDQLLDNPDFAIEVFQRLKAERERTKVLEIENAKKTQIINELQPKATYYDLVLQNKSLLPITKIAKDYGMSGKTMNKLLHELGVQYKMGDTWLLYQEHASKGFTQSKTHVIDSGNSKLNTYWTQKGRLFIYDLLKTEKGILPLIERQQSA